MIINGKNITKKSDLSLKENCKAKRPFKILQNETKIVKIYKAVFEIFNFKDQNSFSTKNDWKTEYVVFRSFAKNKQQ